MKVAKVNFGETIGSGDCFWGTTLQEVRYVVEGYSAFDPGSEPVYPETVELHFWKCYGGEVFEGYAIYNYLRDLTTKGVKVISYSHSLVASIAVLVYLAGDTRYADDASQAFTHKPSSDLGAYANATDMRAAADSLDKIQEQIAGVYVSRAGITPEQAHNYLNSDAWQTADEMVSSGFATAKTSGALVAPAGAEKVINYFKPQNPQNMPLTAEEKTGFLAEVKNMVGDLFKSFKNEAPEPEAPEPVAAPVNLAVTLAGDAGNIYVDTTEGEIAEGDMVYTDEAMTQTAPDGDHALADGRTITTSGGAITAIVETPANEEAPVTNTADDKDARIAELESQLAAMNSEVAGHTSTIRNLQNKLKEVPGSTGNPNKPGLQISNGKPATNSTSGSTGTLSIKRT